MQFVNFTVTNVITIRFYHEQELKTIFDTKIISKVTEFPLLTLKLHYQMKDRDRELYLQKYKSLEN
jgi:hypothetical protein